MVSRTVRTDVIDLAEYLVRCRRHKDTPITIVVPDSEAYNELLQPAENRLTVGQLNCFLRIKLVLVESATELLECFDVSGDSLAGGLIGVFGAFTFYSEDDLLSVQQIEYYAQLINSMEYYDANTRVYLVEPTLQVWDSALRNECGSDKVLLQIVLHRWNVSNIDST